MKKQLFVFVTVLCCFVNLGFAQIAAKTSKIDFTHLGVEDYKNKRYASAYKNFLKDTALHYPVGQYHLGIMFYYGNGVKENKYEAFKWFTKSASNVYEPAQFELANMYLNGVGVAKNDSLAYHWFLRAAEANYTSAFNQLGVMTELGQSLKQNYMEARKWYLKGAYKNDATSEVNLGRLYRKGIGVTKNDSIAFIWFLQAANDGQVSAVNEIGSMYRDGIGIKQDFDKAKQWYVKADSLGSKKAKGNLQFLLRAVKAKEQEINLNIDSEETIKLKIEKQCGCYKSLKTGTFRHESDEYTIYRTENLQKEISNVGNKNYFVNIKWISDKEYELTDYIPLETENQENKGETINIKIKSCFEGQYEYDFEATNLETGEVKKGSGRLFKIK